jgi:hypothetical protein
MALTGITAVGFGAATWSILRPRRVPTGMGRAV